MNGETLTINLSTDELKKLIRDEIADVITDRPTAQDVKVMVKTEVDAAINPAIQELQAQLQTGMAGLNARFANIEALIARLGEQSRNLNEWVQSMNAEQKRIDDEQDEIKRGQSRIESRQVEQMAKLESQERAIFGDPTRPGTKSIVDHISDNFEQWGNRIGQQLETMQSDVQAVAAQVEQTNAKVNTIETVVEENRQFRLKRQRIEQTIIRLIPNTVKKTLGDVAWDWVKSKAIPATLGATLFSLLLEWLRATS